MNKWKIVKLNTEHAEDTYISWLAILMKLKSSMREWMNK